MRRIYKNFPMAVASVIVVAILSACSSTNPDASDRKEDISFQSDSGQTADEFADVVYGFEDSELDGEQSFQTLPGQSVSVRFSDDLKTVLQGEPTNYSPVIESYTLTPISYETGACVLDIEIDYAEGFDIGIFSGSSTISDTEYMSDLELGGSTDQNKLERFYYFIDQRAEVPDNAVLVETMPSDNELENKSYVSADFTHIKDVNRCQPEVASGHFHEMVFRSIDSSSTSDLIITSPAAQLFATVVAGGVLVISDSSVDGAVRTIAGKWEGTPLS